MKNFALAGWRNNLSIISWTGLCPPCNIFSNSFMHTYASSSDSRIVFKVSSITLASASTFYNLLRYGRSSFSFSSFSAFFHFSSFSLINYVSILIRWIVWLFLPNAVSRFSINFLKLGLFLSALALLTYLSCILLISLSWSRSLNTVLKALMN